MAKKSKVKGLFNLITEPDWQNHIDERQINYVDTCGSFYRYCDIGGSKFIVPCSDEQMKTLADLGASLNYPNPIVKNEWSKIPANLIRYAWRYFAAVYEECKCEAAVLLYYHPTDKLWSLLVPVQYNCSHASVSYAVPNNLTIKEIEEDKDMKKQYAETVEEAEELEEDGYILMGTIHSHCDFDAFHSGTDDADEVNFDGVHITIGRVNTETPNFASRIMVNGMEITMKMEEIAEMNLSGKVKISKDLLGRHHKRVVRYIASGNHSHLYRVGGLDVEWNNHHDNDRPKWWERGPDNAWEGTVELNNNDDEDALEGLIDIESVGRIRHKSGEVKLVDLDHYSEYSDELRSLGWTIVED